MTEEKSSAMVSNSVKTGIQTWSLVVAILTFLPGAYAFLYFTERDHYLASRYFRALGELDRQINQGLVSLDQMMGFALVPAMVSKGCSEEKNPCQEYRNYLAKFSDRFSDIKFGELDIDLGESKQHCNQSDVESSILTDKTFFDVNGSPQNRKLVIYECKNAVSDTGNANGNPIHGRITATGANQDTDSKTKFVFASVSLKKLIDPTAALEFFDQILLLNSKGHVVYRSGSDDLGKTSNVAARDDYARFENLSHYLQNERVRELDLSKGLENFKVDRKTMLRDIAHSTIREATIGKVDYLLFIQPFHTVREQVPWASSAKGSQSNKKNGSAAGDSLAYLVGVVPYKKYFFDIVSLPLAKITVLVLVFLFLITVIPHLKLLLSGRYFLPNRLFAWWLGISFPMLTVILFNACYIWNQYIDLEQGVSRQAVGIADAIEKNFFKEIDSLMEVFAQQRAGAATAESKSAAILAGGESAASCEGKEESNELIYPEYGIAFYIDRQGKIVGCERNNRTVRTVTDSSVKKREYFSVPRFHPENLWARNHRSENRGDALIPYYGQRIQSYDHGLKLSAWSIPLHSTNRCEEDEPCIFAVVKAMQTFFAPILPLGFGFAVIDDHSGKVYYHSDDQRSLLENFFIETDRDSELIAAVQSRRRQFVSGTYHAKFHRFFVNPLQDTPWSLIVYYDEESMDLVNLRTVLMSLIYSIAGVFLLFAIPLVTYLIFPSVVYLPLRGFLPNGNRMLKIRSWINEKLKASRITGLGNSVFGVVYLMGGIALVFLVFGSISWIAFNCASASQLEKFQRFNLFHSAQALRARANLLDVEQQRLGIKQGKGLEATYLNGKVPLAEFAVYVKPYFPHGYQVEFSLTEDDPRCLKGRAQQSQVNCARNNLVVADGDESQYGRPGSADGLREFRETMPDVERYLPILSGFDAHYLQMESECASDGSWKFTGTAEGISLCVEHDAPSVQAAQAAVSQPTDGIKYQSPQGWNIALHTKFGPSEKSDWEFANESEGDQAMLLGLALFLILVIYQLAKQTAMHLMGLYLPNPYQWEEKQRNYDQEFPIEVFPQDSPAADIGAKNNLQRIKTADSSVLKELRAIVFQRSRNRIINTSNVTPIMLLILGGVLRNENGLRLRDSTMKEWIQHQPWEMETKQFLSSHRSGVWRILAPSFYALLLLGFLLITMSGGSIGNFLMAILPVALAGGVPAVMQMVREKLK